MLTNNAEGGTNGVTPTTSDTGSGDQLSEILGPPAGGTNEYTTTQSAHGTTCYRARTDTTAGASGVGLGVGGTIVSGYHRVYIFHDAATIASAFNCIAVRVGTTAVAFLDISATKKLRLKGGNGVVVYAGTTTITESQWWRVEFYIEANGTTSVNGQYWLYSYDSASVTEDSTLFAMTANSAISNYDTIRMGQLNTSLTSCPAAGAYFYWDDMAFGHTSQIGPAVLPPPQVRQPGRPVRGYF